MKRLMASFLCIALIAVFAVPAALCEYKTKWNIGDVYENSEAVDADKDAAMGLISQIRGYSGRLRDPEVLRDYMELKNDVEKIIYRIDAYANLLNGLNASDAQVPTTFAISAFLSAEYSKAMSFEDGEFSSMTPEERTRLVESKELEDFRQALEYITNEDTVWLGKETIEALATFSQALGTNKAAYEKLLYSELPYPVYYTPDGERVVLDNDGYHDLIESNVTPEQQITIDEKYAKRFSPYENTFASLLDGHMRGQWALAQINGFDSVREYCLNEADVEPEIYDLIIDAGHRSADLLNRYRKVYFKYLGITQENPYYSTVSKAGLSRKAENNADYFSATKTYDESVDDVKAALSLLGDEYIDVFDSIIDAGHVDVYPAAGKYDNAFCQYAADDTLPYVLLNYDENNSGDGAGALAHEMGHAIYGYYSYANQPFQYREPGIFTNEVASTANELMFYNYMYDNAKSDSERLYYLRTQIDLIYVTYFRQMLFSEMEDYCYKVVEGGGALTPELLNAKYGELNDIYGDAYRKIEGDETEWAGLPPFYSNYYVYQYVTSITYSTAIASKILAGDTETLNSFLDFLKLGGSLSPCELLRGVGIDPLDSKTYDAPIEYFSRLLDQYESLLNDMGLAE